MKVFKYEFDHTGEKGVMMPFGAEILHAGIQHEKTYVWALVDENSKVDQARRFRVYGTGSQLIAPQAHKHISTIVVGGWVWHVFELVDE